MNLDSLRDVFHEQLKDMYSAEKQLTEALPKLAQAASSSELQQAFEDHLQVTKQQMETVRQILDQMDVNPGNKKCAAMEGLVEEGNEMAKEKGDPDARDAGLICAAQKVEHYEIATYGSLRTWAKLLGETEVAQTLQEILDQEYDADNLLDQLAEGYLNQKAKN
ncbi:ferritin-like domain-containing protein [Phototrophicus methaneseepsis]|uniref:Ferritin-like domain-containing protein n=1 Tax=Phototrophicus methaneseepsis TaxID=2710758 RepID=A0A7S8E530_9CHLR|nr:ferritin-like domain-containing protein [Phototrophicus methaneseepsis]QPC80500.1 ferritin-like domain-containing protein [Phototrophicus methaneseepsis]